MTKITVLLLAALLAHPFDSPAEDTPVTSETDWTQKLLATRPAPRDFFALATMPRKRKLSYLVDSEKPWV